MFFSSKKKKSGPPPEDQAQKLANTIQFMKTTSEGLDKRIEHLRRLRDGARIKGQQLLKSKDKVAAKNQLIYMRKYDKEIESLYGKKNNLDTQIMALQSTAVDKDVMNAMRMGRNIMAEIVSENTLDEADDVIQDIQESYAQAQELSDALARPMGDEEVIDDDDLLAAFEEEQEELDTNFEEDFDVNVLPSVPTRSTQTQTQTQTKAKEVVEEDDDEAQLAALMGM